MIKCDTSKLEEQLKKFHEEAIKKLKGMVRRFSYSITMRAIGNTPIGDAVKNADLYAKRVTDPAWQSYGLDPMEGFAKGSWRVSMDGTLDVQALYGAAAGETAGDLAVMELGSYKLGETVIISNRGPYIRNINNPSDRASIQTNGQGVIPPTIDAIMNIYQYRLDDYYQMKRADGL
jgi:hypothetical protein